MSDMVDGFRAMKRMHQLERERMGVPCPVCREKLPKAHPKTLLPQQTCRAHKPHYRDPRPEPTPEQWNEAMTGTGWSTKIEGQPA